MQILSSVNKPPCSDVKLRTVVGPMSCSCTAACSAVQAITFPSSHNLWLTRCAILKLSTERHWEFEVNVAQAIHSPSDSSVDGLQIYLYTPARNCMIQFVPGQTTAVALLSKLLRLLAYLTYSRVGWLWISSAPSLSSLLASAPASVLLLFQTHSPESIYIEPCTGNQVKSGDFDPKFGH